MLLDVYQVLIYLYTISIIVSEIYIESEDFRVEMKFFYVAVYKLAVCTADSLIDAGPSFWQK